MILQNYLKQTAAAQTIHFRIPTNLAGMLPLIRQYTPAVFCEMTTKKVIILCTYVFLVQSGASDDLLDVISKTYELTMIQGYPCGIGSLDSLPDFEDLKTAFPRECDNLCVETGACQSVLWSMEDSSCTLFPFSPTHLCYSPHPHLFWLKRAFVAAKHNFTQYFTMTESNGYGTRLFLDNNDAFYDVVCSLPLFPPISLYAPTDLDSLQKYVVDNAVPDGRYQTGLKKGPHDNDIYSLVSDKHMLLFETNKWQQTFPSGNWGSSNDCVYYTVPDNAVSIADCDQLNNGNEGLCKDEHGSATCEKQEDVPSYESLVYLEDAKSNMVFFVSKEKCDSELFQSLSESNFEGIKSPPAAFASNLRAAAKIVHPDKDFGSDEDPVVTGMGQRFGRCPALHLPAEERRCT